MQNKNVVLLKVFNFFLGFSLFAPLAIIYFSRVSGSYALGASILGITMLSSALFEVPTGIWSDRVGRRVTIILGSWARLTTYILYAIGLSYWWLVLGAVFDGLSHSFFSGNNDALLHDSLIDAGKGGEYKDYLGKISAIEHFAMGASALIGGYIGNFSFTYLMWLSVISQITLLCLSYRFSEPSHVSLSSTNVYRHLADAIKLFISNKKLRLLSISDSLSYSTGEVSFQFRASFLQTVWPIWAIGLVSTITHVVASASYYFSGRMISYLGSERVLLIRSIYGKFSSLIAYGIPSVFSPLIVITPSVIYGAGQVAKNDLMQREFSSAQRATMSSLNSLFSSLGFAFMSLAIGLFADFTSPATALFTITLISLPSIPIHYQIFKTRNI